MPVQNVMVDGQTYAVEALSDEAKNLLALIQASNDQITKAQAALAIADTARQVYTQQLKTALPDPAAN
jgi:hypothetical protein